MAQHNKTGMEGEALAVKYFIERGYTIIHRNWVFGKLEIDIIALGNQKLHFIEVKTRNSLFFGYPEEGISRRKITNVMKAAEQYMILHPGSYQVQVDVLSIVLRQGDATEFYLIENVTLP